MRARLGRLLPDTDYEFFNNTSNDLTIYAQGNIWGMGSQDSTLVASQVWDAHDAGGHGEVIFTAPSASIDPVALTTPSARTAVITDVYRLDGIREAIQQLGDEALFHQLIARRGMHVLRDSEGHGRIVKIN